MDRLETPSKKQLRNMLWLQHFEIVLNHAFAAIGPSEFLSFLPRAPRVRAHVVSYNASFQRHGHHGLSSNAVTAALECWFDGGPREWCCQE